MYFTHRDSLLVRFVFLSALLGGLLGTGFAAQALPSSSARAGLQSDDCEPGTVWVWAQGPARPEIAHQAEAALKKEGFDATVAASDFGEKDSCGNFEVYSTDFTVTLKNNSSLKGSPQAQKGTTDRLRAALKGLGKPRLGNLQIDFGDGLAKSYPDSAAVPTSMNSLSATSDSASGATASMNKKVFLLVYDPTLANGQTLSTYMGWSSYTTLVQGIVSSFQNASNGQLQYTIAQTQLRNEWPAKIDGFRYTETTYFQVWQGQTPAHNPDEVNYDSIIDQFDLCGKLNRGEIDELWMFGAPYFGFYESRLVGPGAYSYNSPPLTQTHNCSKLLPIMGLSYERGTGEAVHSFGHREEATMTRVYGSWEENRTAHNWDRFGLVKSQSPNYNYSGCGSIHYPLNALIAYDYSSSTNTLTNCEDFRNYPSLSDPQSVSQPLNCTAWNCDQLGFLVYWFNHLPSGAGCGPDVIESNWWSYFVDPSSALAPSLNCSPPPCPTITNWRGEYWNNTSFLGSPIVCRDDSGINFDWGAASPGALLPADYFSARWTRTVFFPGGIYRFYMLNDDGARLYVDDALRLDAWGTCCTWAQTDVTLPAGDHTIRMEMFENFGGAAAKLQWEQIGQLPTSTPTPTNTFTPTPTPIPSRNPLYLSLSSRQIIGGVASSDEDILKFDGTNWSLFFDGSDVGVGSPDLFAFTFLDADSILMSFTASVTVNGITATPQDVLRFDAASLGSTTTGTFSLYFDGSDVGFEDTTNEKIDSLSLLPDGRLLISSTGNPVVPGVSSPKDEDVLAFTPTTLGNTTSGTWAMYFDGSDVGLSETSGEDVDALDVVGSNIYLSTQDIFSVPGLSGADEDVFVCAATSLGNTTACNYAPALYFDGSTWGLAANDVDAFNFLASGTVPTNTPTPTGSSTSTNTPTRTPTPTGTISPTSTATATPTPTGAVSKTQTPTASPTPTGTQTPTRTATATPSQTPTATQTSSSTSSTFTFTPIADAYVNSGSVTTNYGAVTTLRTDASPDLHSYLRFNIQGVGGNITRATLRIYANSASTIGCTANSLSNNTWTESTITYSNAPSVGSVIGSSSPFGAGAWISINVTTYITGNGTYNFGLTTPSSTAISFASREAGANAPQLIVETGP